LPPGKGISDSEFVWLSIGGRPRGRIIPVVADQLHRLPDLFETRPDGFALRDAGEGVQGRSRLLQRAALELRAAGLVPGWRDECCVLLDEQEAEVARFERGAFRTLGLQNRAVHINGMLADGRIWIARRSPRKASAPNKLDQMAAGAISAGETPAECAVRELWEEAGVPADISVRTRFTGASIVSLRRLKHGVHDERVLCANLLLPGTFTPECQDGEVAEFLCMHPEEVAEALTAGEFSIEAGLVAADWLERSCGRAGLTQ
jgi:8-oxo-dGTP pyrophosphatase MutT (NUDIX family)